MFVVRLEETATGQASLRKPWSLSRLDIVLQTSPRPADLGRRDGLRELAELDAAVAP